MGCGSSILYVLLCVYVFDVEWMNAGFDTEFHVVNMCKIITAECTNCRGYGDLCIRILFALSDCATAAIRKKTDFQKRAKYHNYTTWIRI